MPAMANITVQNAAAANVTYTAATPSAGDKTPAVWRQNAASEIIGFRPSLSVATRDNAKRDGRIFESEFKVPVFMTDTSGKKVLLAVIPFFTRGTLPTTIDAAQVNDAFVQYGNLMASSLLRSVVSEGYAPT